MHGLGNIPRGVIMQGNLTFQQFFSWLMQMYTHYIHSTIAWRLLKRQLLSSSQIIVDESGQPVYRLLEELQWRFSNGYGPEKYFWLFGSLHLEKSILLLCGLLIEGSLDNIGIVWIIHCWNRLFGVSKPHQKGKLVY